MSKILAMPRHLRPREKLLAKGPSNLTDRELLAILLRTGTAGESALTLAGKILSQHPLTKLLNLTYEQLCKLKGVGPAKAITILAAFELTRRATAAFDNTLPIISSPQDALDQLTELRHLKKEHFVVLYLNARNQLLHKETISVGTLTSSLVHPREVFAPAISLPAASIMLAHNHPSGDPNASEEDLALTTKLERAGQLLGINILDHLILTSNTYSTLSSIGLLPSN